MLTPVILNDFGKEVLHMTSANAELYNDKTDGVFVVCDTIRNGYRFNVGAKIVKYLSIGFNNHKMDGKDIYERITDSIVRADHSLKEETHSGSGIIEMGVSMSVIVVHNGYYIYLNFGERSQLYLKRSDGSFYKNGWDVKRHDSPCLFSDVYFERLNGLRNTDYGITKVEQGDRLLLCTQEIAECIGQIGLGRVLADETMDGTSVMSEILGCTDSYSRDAHSAILIDVL